MNCPYYGKFKVTSIQGERTLNGKKEYHDGLDMVGVDSKKIHSTINGTVEKAGWENFGNKKQGFGLYVRIKADNSSDKYYFGHLSKISVTKGQKVKIGDVLGIEGNTGNSTGSHCHYCIRVNGSKQNVKNVSKISGIPNKIGNYENKIEEKSQTEPTVKKTARAATQKKSNEQIAKEVIKGLWGNGASRKTKLTAAGYNYTKIQAIVNKMLGGK